MKQMQRTRYSLTRKLNLEIQLLEDDEVPLTPGTCLRFLTKMATILRLIMLKGDYIRQYSKLWLIRLQDQEKVVLIARFKYNEMRC